MSVQTASDRATGSVALLLLGAGSGTRLGHARPKALVEVGGRPLLAHALASVMRTGMGGPHDGPVDGRAVYGAVYGPVYGPAISEVVVTAPVAEVARFEQVAAAALRDAAGVRQFERAAVVTRVGKPADKSAIETVSSASTQLPTVRVIAGGVARSDSVAVALRVLSGSVDLVLVHDVARAFAPSSLIHSVIAALRSNPQADAVVPALPVTDTIKVVDLVGEPAGNSDCELVAATLDRGRLRAAQTPQGFRVAALKSALCDAQARREATDDADLVARNGGSVVAIPGAAAAFKITHPFDLVIAEALCADRSNNEHPTTCD